MDKKRFLHVGCGTARKDRTTPYFAADEWEEVRLDIDPSVQPDIIGNITTLEGLEDESFDAVFSSHNIEHLYAHEVSSALTSFFRVVKKGGHMVVTCPDLQSVCAHIAEGKLLEPLYQSASGPVAPLDILYGFRPALLSGAMSMAHHCGFTAGVLQREILRVGFATVWIKRTNQFSLAAVASKQAVDEEDIRALAHRHFPQG